MDKIKCEVDGDVTKIVAYIAQYDVGAKLFNLMISIDVECIISFGDECVSQDWLESKDGRYADRVIYIDLSKKHPWLKWYYRRKLKNILRKYGVKVQ